MRDLLQFLARYGHVITFVILQFICFRLIIAFNQNQQEIYFFNKALLSSGMQERLSEWKGYLELDAVADSLAQENAALRTQLRDAKFLQDIRIDTIADSLYRQQYIYVSAQVISNSINGQNNFVIIDKGAQDDIKEGMGVISSNGAVGIVSYTTEKYSRVLPLHNRTMRVSVKLARAGYFGGLRWSGGALSDFKIQDIPRHAVVNVGDSILTSGYSVVFPKGIFLGQVRSIGDTNGTNFLDVNADLNINLADLGNVYVVKNLYSQELDSLMKIQ